MEQPTPFLSARRGKWQPTPNIFAFSHETKGTLALRYFVEVTMPKSKIYTSPSAEDPSTNGTVTEHSQAIGGVPLKKSEADSPGDDHTTGVAAGRLPEEVYANTLSWRRAALRRRCVAVVEWETEVIAKWQVLLSSQIEGRWKGKRLTVVIVFCRRVSSRPGWTRISSRLRCSARTLSFSSSSPCSSFLGTLSWEEGEQCSVRGELR